MNCVPRVRISGWTRSNIINNTGRGTMSHAVAVIRDVLAMIVVMAMVIIFYGSAITWAMRIQLRSLRQEQKQKSDTIGHLKSDSVK